MTLSNEDILAHILATPELLWAVKTSKKKVAGPWVPARSEKNRRGISGEAIWRLTHKGNDIAAVHLFWPGCDGWIKPSPGDFTMFQDEEYNEAMAAYKAAVAVRADREWVYRINGEGTKYASTKEEAVTLADEVLKERGYLLLDSLDEAQMLKYRA